MDLWGRGSLGSWVFGVMASNYFEVMARIRGLHRRASNYFEVGEGTNGQSTFYIAYGELVQYGILVRLSSKFFEFFGRWSWSVCFINPFGMI